MVQIGGRSEESRENVGTLQSTPTRRRHTIVLCCAESVRPMVDEVGHSLAGLGFRTEVVWGKEARAILLGRDRNVAEPTIYVVCVQGSLKAQVLEPLRQALVTHGGPNQHLFAAVLDLSLPLAMVGQVRRFSEALERLPGTAAIGGGRERRQWREHSGESPIERSAGKPVVIGKPMRTATEQVATVLRPPKVDRAADIVAAKPASATVEPVRDIEPVVEERRSRPRPLPQPTPIMQSPLVLVPAPRRGRIVAVAALAIAAATIAWVALPLQDEGASSESIAPTLPVAVSSPAPVSPHDEDDDATSVSAGSGAALAETTPTAEEVLAAAAADTRRIRRGPNLWVSRPQGDTSTWSIARERCARYDVDGVGDWRLPFRRELQMLRAADLVDDGAWWSRTLVADDKDAAYVLDAGKGELIVWLKAEPNAGTLCVRSRSGA